MRFLPELFERNRTWARRRKEQDPGFFEALSRSQNPDYLWIGCADSRVPASEIVDVDPGRIFEHRNVANVVAPDDPNALSVLRFAVDALKVTHVIVCGHYGCGGVQAALSDEELPWPLDAWLKPVRALREVHAAELGNLDGEARWRRLCELSVTAQVEVVCATEIVGGAWRAGRPLAVHGWIYDLGDGLLRDLDVTREG